MAKTQPIEVPGAPAAADPAAEAAAINAAAQNAETSQAELIQRLLAENAALKAAQQPAADTPSIVYEPETPHWKQTLAASPTGHLTVAEAMALIDAGKLAMPVTAYACRDGNLARYR